MPFTIFFFVVGSCMLRLFHPGSDGNETVKAITFHQLQYFDSSESDTDTFPTRTSRKFGSARKARPVWNMTQDLVSVRPTVWGSILFGWKLILWTEAEKKSSLKTDWNRRTCLGACWCMVEEVVAVRQINQSESTTSNGAAREHTNPTRKTNKAKFWWNGKQKNKIASADLKA